MRYIKNFMGGFFFCAAIIALILFVKALIHGDSQVGHYSMSFIGDAAFALWCFDLIEVKWLGIKNNT